MIHIKHIYFGTIIFFFIIFFIVCKEKSLISESTNNLIVDSVDISLNIDSSKQIHYSDTQVYHLIESRQYNLNLCKYLYKKGNDLLKHERYDSANSVFELLESYLKNFKIKNKTNLSDFYYKWGCTKRQLSEYEVAITLLDESLTLCDNIDLYCKSKNLIELAIVKGNMRYYDEAYKLVDSAHEYCKINKDTVTLIKCLYVKGIYSVSIGQYHQIYKIYEELLSYPSNFYSLINVYKRLLEAAIKENNLKRANLYFYKIQVLNQSELEYSNISQAHLFTIYADYYFLKKNFVKAIKYINKSLNKLSTQIYFNSLTETPSGISDNEIPEMVFHYMGLKANLIYKQYKISKSKSLLEKSITHYRFIDSVFLQHSAFKDDAEELHALDIMSEIYFNTIKVLSEKRQITKSPELNHLINEYSERIRYKRLYRKISLNNLELEIEDTLLHKLILTETEISKKLVQNEDINLEDLQNNREKNRNILKKNYPVIYKRLFIPQIKDLHEIKSWCKINNSRIIEFYENLHGDLIIIQTNENLFDVKYFENLSNETNSLKHFMKHKDDSSRNILLKSIDCFDSNNLQKYNIIIPDAKHANLPLHLLFVQDSVIQNKNLFTFYSFLKSSLIKKNIDSIINIKYNSALTISIADKGNSELPYTYLESKLIEEHINNVTIYRGPNSNFKNLIKTNEIYDFVHIGTHGVPSKDSKNKSGLIFNDGFVSANQLSFIQLKNTKTLLLSACYSNFGEVKIGEGIESVIKAFASNDINIIIGYFYEVNDLQCYRDLKYYLNGTFNFNQSEGRVVYIN